MVRSSPTKCTLAHVQSLRKPQGELLYHLLTQQNSKDAIHSVLGVNRNDPQPSQLVEESLVTLGLVAMELSEVRCFHNIACVSYHLYRSALTRGKCLRCGLILPVNSFTATSCNSLTLLQYWRHSGQRSVQFNTLQFVV